LVLKPKLLQLDFYFQRAIELSRRKESSTPKARGGRGDKATASPESPAAAPTPIMDLFFRVQSVVPADDISDQLVEGSLMHLERVFRCVCIRIINREQNMEANCELVDPRRASIAFAVLHTAYKTAKRLVEQYGNVRVFSAEASHRPAGTCVEVPNVFIYTHDRARNRTEFSHGR
jgi:hypothetical protein